VLKCLHDLHGGIRIGLKQKYFCELSMLPKSDGRKAAKNTTLLHKIPQKRICGYSPVVWHRAHKNMGHPTTIQASDGHRVVFMDVCEQNHEMEAGTFRHVLSMPDFLKKI
jgi:hypothetical protein